jgi:hypothetical protein
MMGPTARIVKVSPSGEQTDVAALPSIMASETESLGGARLTWMDGTLYATVGGWVDGAGDPPDLAGVVARVEGSDVTEVADMWAYEDVVEFGMFTEQGPVPNAGAVVRIHEGDASEVVVSGLPFPTSLVFDPDGNAYVTFNGVGAPGSGAVVRFDALTGMEGESISMGQ